jgi:LysM repeat protein
MGARGEIPGAGPRGHFRELVERAGDRQFDLRMLAPASIVVFLVIFLIVVVASLGGGSDSPSSKPERAVERPRRAQQGETRTTEKTTSTTTTPATGVGRSAYVVRAGDTLAIIAQKTGVGVPDLLELNPDIDPRALVTGQRIKLR